LEEQETGMANAEETAFVGRLLEAYAVNYPRMSVASKSPKDRGVPLEMYVGEVDADGWVEWRILPSTLEDSDVARVENEFNVQFPPLFRAYLLARFQLFDQVRSQRYNQQILTTSTPVGRPLKPLRELMSAWRPLIDAGFIPFSEWGDGWGPMCFDSAQRAADLDCPIVWMDHERLIPFEKCRLRSFVLPLVQPIYRSFREFLLDVFSGKQGSSGKSL